MQLGGQLDNSRSWLPGSGLLSLIFELLVGSNPASTLES
jgi:hypothetical protein